MDEEGRYNVEAGEKFQGLEVLKDGTEKVIDHLGEDIVHVEKIVHSYPHDWRSKTPVIMRASHQWFIDLEQMQQKAIVSSIFNFSSLREGR